MAIGANSYGTVAQVAALTRRYTDNGSYVHNTNPTVATVEAWINSVSATLNVSLAAAGFKIPITQTDAAAACAALVVEATADLCHAANSTGRFFTKAALERGVSPLMAIRKEMDAWVEAQADGLEQLGATRNRSLTAGILYRDADEGGDETFPIFQRDGFSNTFTDWDNG